MPSGLLGIEELDRAEIEAILARAKDFQPLQSQSLKKLDTLRGKMIVNLFYGILLGKLMGAEGGLMPWKYDAILWHLVSNSPLRPEDRIDRARALQWMFFEQHSIEPNLGAAYFWLALVKGGRDLQQHALEDWMEEGNRALGVMENHLKRHRYLHDLAL